jgi:predicted kinase
MRKNKPTPTVKILIGVPASGKSTLSKQLLSENANLVRVNRDDIRFMLRNQPVLPHNLEEIVSDIQTKIITSALRNNKDVLVDNTNLKQKYLKQLINLTKTKANIEFIVLDITLEEAIERDKHREKRVGEDVIRKMWNDFNILKKEFNFNPILKEKTLEFKQRPTNNKPDAVIFDIDGTLANMVDRSPYDWKRVDEDVVNERVSELVNFHKSLGRKIIILSGRDGSCKELTEKWLKENNIHFDEFHIRTEGDMRKDSIIKKEIFNNLIEPNYNVICVFDDRLQVLDMWFEEGIFTFNVNQGNIDF